MTFAFCTFLVDNCLKLYLKLFLIAISTKGNTTSKFNFKPVLAALNWDENIFLGFAYLTHLSSNFTILRLHN